MKQPRLRVVPCELAESNAFVLQQHRHHGPVLNHRFSLAVIDEADDVRGVAIVGRPVARALQDGWTVEVTRVATDGCPNACSALYGAAWRAARALGYRRLVTYTLPSESGSSLRAAGFPEPTVVGQRGSDAWSTLSRPRVNLNPRQLRFRWDLTA